MDKGLETYLQTVKNELGGLEAEQRDSELREMRQHIEAIVSRLIEGGLNESEATDAAIAQFGEAHKVGRELSRVSEERDSLWRILLATGCAVASYQWLIFAFELLGGWKMNYWMNGVGLVRALLYAYFPLLAGAIAGSISRSWFGRALACLSVAAVAFNSGSWFMWWPSSLTLLVLLFSGAFFGSRWNLKFSINLERKDSKRIS